MLMKDSITKLLDMEHMILNDLEIFSDHITLHVEMKRRTEPCPDCGTYTDMIHDYRTQWVRDIPFQGKNLYWKYRKRRYRCPCCEKRFYERNGLLPKFHRLTNRLAFLTMARLKEKISRKDVAKEFHVSESTVLRWMNLTEYGRPNKLPKVLSIDEFRGNAGGEKFQCILTSPVERKIFDILPDCKERHIFEYLRQFPNRNEVKCFISDMKSEYIALAKVLFPNAKIVVDRFHVIRYCTWAVENVRKRIQKSIHPDERKYFKRSRTLLLKHKELLKDSSREAVIRMLRFHKDLQDAYLLKEKFYSFMDSKDSTEGRKRLKEFVMMATVADLPEFHDLMRLLKNNTPYILNSFDCRYTNGFTEGCNNKIKVLKRIAFGYRNFSNFRQRILMTVS